jgi:DNA-binding HxlR family transcriptional regulator
MKSTHSPSQIGHTKHIAKIIGDSSNILILYELMHFGPKSFNELKRMTEINAVTLSKKLQALKAEGIVDSKICGNENHYSTTDKAEAFRPLVADIERIIVNKED